MCSVGGAADLKLVPEIAKESIPVISSSSDAKDEWRSSQYLKSSNTTIMILADRGTGKWLKANSDI